MNSIINPFKKPISWMEQAGPSTGGVPVGLAPTPQPGTDMTGAAAQPAPAPEPAAAAPAPTQATIPQVTMPASSPAPVVQNITNMAPPPPAFGMAPESAKPQPKGSTPTFLGQSALPKKQRAAGAYGFDQQNSGTKTLIGS